MERASQSFVKWYVQQFDQSRAVWVICGTGNNGGDGLAISRLLIKRGYQVRVYTIKGATKGTEDFRINRERLSAQVEIRNIEKIEAFDFMPASGDVVIDAIFGSGLTREIEGVYAEVILQINRCGMTIVSVDIPSGLFCDEHSVGEAIVRADHVVTFQLPKLAFFMPENQAYVGQWSVVDIGLSREFLQRESTDYHILKKSGVRRMLKKREKFAHKGSFGKVLLISGSYGKMGAAVLCARACQRTGAGLVTVHAPSLGYSILQTAVPEAMVSVDFSQRFISGIPDTDAFDVIGIGPGIDTHNETCRALEQLLTSSRKPLVLDADALNILSSFPDLLEKLPAGSILTPHPGEFIRLAGRSIHDFDRLQKLKAFAGNYRVYVVLKGYNTAIATPEGKVYFNSTGNPGMATGGSGDVLTGMIAGLLAQGYASESAAILGVFLHGLAGDVGVEVLGEASLIASDIIEYIPGAFLRLKSS
jgi:NAD(P)H-hydrate epimerase